MTGPSLIPIDHAYIEAHGVAERFVTGQLTQYERDAFERHYVGCTPCMDRIALAKIFNVEGQTLAARQRTKRQVGIFNVLATFTALQQGTIFAVATLALLLIPVAGMNWTASRATVEVAESEPVIWLPPVGAVEARVLATAPSLTIAAAVPGQAGTFRLSIVDVSNRTLVAGTDQSAGQGLALGLRLPSLPAGVTFAVIEQRAENGAYSMVSRHPLMIQWR